jgi:hypothetical protein
VFGASSRVLCIAPLGVFGADFCFNFCSNARFQLCSLADSGFRSEYGFFFCLPSREGLGPKPGLFFSHQPGRFLSLATSCFISATLCFCFSKTARMFGCESLRFLFRAAARLFFGGAAGFIFRTTPLLGFGAHLRFDFGPQARFFFRPAQSFCFGLTARFLFGPATRNVFCQPLRLSYGPDTSGFPSLHALDFFFDCPEPHLGATAQLIFLRFLSGFTLQVMPLLFGAMAGVFFFRLP